MKSYGVYFSDLFHLALYSSSIHVVANGKILFFSWVNNIPVCMCVCVCVFISNLYYYYFFFWIGFRARIRVRVKARVRVYVYYLVVQRPLQCDKFRVMVEVRVS